MTRSGIKIHRTISIVLRSLVLIQHNHGNGRAQRDPVLGARLNLHLVFFISRGRQRTLPWPSSCHLRLDVGRGKRQARRAAIDDAADGAAM